MVFWFSEILQKNSHPFIDIFMTFKKLKIWKHSMKDWSLQQDTVVLWSNSSFIRSEGWGFRSHRCQKSFTIQINKNLFAEVRAEEKEKTLTHRVSLSSSSRRRRGDEKRKRKKWRHHLKHQSYLVAPSDSICVILTKLLLRNLDHRWWLKKKTSHFGGSHKKRLITPPIR